MPEISMTYGSVDTIALAKETRDQAKELYTDWDKRAVGYDNINSDSVIVDVGGYRGRWSYQMAVRYNPNLFIFEPQPWCCEAMKELLKDYKAQIYPFALGTKKGSFPICNFETDGCSFEEELAGEHRTLGGSLPMRKMSTEFEIIGLDHIDVMHMNIEGGEMTLVPHMLKNNIFPEILLLQHHDPVYTQDMYTMLGKHYDLLYDYGTILSAWRFNV